MCLNFARVGRLPRPRCTAFNFNLLEGGVRYKALKNGIVLKKGDQFYSTVAYQWTPVSLLVGSIVGQTAGKFRRPITGNKSNAAQRAIKRSNKKTGRA